MTRGAGRIPIVLAFAFASVAAGPCVDAQIIQTPETKVIPKLTVKGRAELEKPADELRIDVGVVTEDEEASAALAANNKLMRDIVAALKKAGLSDDEFETGRFRIRPNYSPRPRAPEPGWRPRIVGFDVVNSLHVKTGRLGLAGDLVQAATSAGANTVDNIRFGLAEPRAHRSEAIANATSNAREDARTLAEAAGVELVRLLSINLDDAATGTPRIGAAAARGFARAEGGSSPPISPGEVTVTAGVTLVYEISQGLGGE